MNKNVVAVAALCLLSVAGCAKSPDSISPSYVSDIQYNNHTCPQLSEEASRLSSAMARAYTQQENARTSDTVGVILLGLPVASLSGDNIAPEIARLKGEAEAIRTASIKKGCGELEIVMPAPKASDTAAAEPAQAPVATPPAAAPAVVQPVAASAAGGPIVPAAQTLDAKRRVQCRIRNVYFVTDKARDCFKLDGAEMVKFLE